MNLFLLHLDPRKAAQAHADKHVVKMILEACQLLYTAHWIAAYPHLLANKSAIKLSAAQKKCPLPQALLTAPPSLTRPEEQGFRPVHIHHPCAQWVRASLGNYLYAAELAIEIAEEFSFRYNGKPHSCEAHAKWLRDHPPHNLLDGRMTPFVMAMPDEYKQEDPVEAYRLYYKTNKKERGLLQYKRRKPPKWLAGAIADP